MKVSRIRDFINSFTRRFLCDSAEYTSELTTLTALRALAPVDVIDESDLNPGQLLQLRQIFHQRDRRIRGTPLDYTYAPNLLVNLCFIRLGLILSSELDEPLVKILMLVTNDVCFNLHVDFRKNSPLSGCANYNDLLLVSNLHTLYFHENTLYSIAGLLVVNKVLPHSSSKRPKGFFSTLPTFSTFSSQDNKTPVAVSPESLRNIRKKTDALPISFNINTIKKRYDSPWSWLREGEIPTWRHKGVFPSATVASLIEQYLMSNTDAEWTSCFKTWSEVLLQNPSIDAVNCLYGQILDKETNLYFVDVLVEISPTNMTPSLDEHMAVIASWFFRRVSAEEGSSRISALFDNHWDCIKDKPGDYFSAPLDQLSPYERLAKKLSQRGIPGWTNYHRALVRTLVDDIDPSYKPLSAFILSEDNKKLYSLECVKENQKRGRGFSKPDTSSGFFSEDEKKRISRSADPIFLQHLAQIHTVEIADKPLACSTIQMLRRFANEVMATYIYDQDRTDQLVQEFYFALEALSADERARLDGKAIRQNGYYLSFSEELEKIQKRPQDVCLYNVIKRLILPIIVDHDPITPFNPSIELISDINTPQPHTSLLKTLRAASRKNVYRDYDGLSSAEALHRLKIVMVAAMSDSFYQKTHTIRMLPDSRASNQGPRVCAEIVRHIAPILLGGGDLLQSRFAYAVMMEHVVKPALLLDPEPDPQPWLWSWWWSSEPKMFTTHAWLSSLLTERLFFDEKAWSVPGSLVRPLRRYADDVRSRTDRSSLDVLVLGCET